MQEQAKYFNALAVSVVLLFEPAGPITLGEHFIPLLYVSFSNTLSG
jgi:hypothetical protein